MLRFISFQRKYVMKEAYTVCFASDTRGVLPLSVAIWSLVSCAHEETTYDIRLLGDNIPAREVENIRNLVKRAGERHEVSYVEIKDMLPEGLAVKERLPRVTWARVFVARMLPDVDRALYLDIDVQVCRDLTELMEMDLEDCVLAGVLEKVPVPGEEFFPELGIPHSSPGYFNAGVLLMDLAAMRRENLVEKVLHFIEKHSEKPLYALDQDALNGALHVHETRSGKIQRLYPSPIRRSSFPSRHPPLLGTTQTVALQLQNGGEALREMHERCRVAAGALFARLLFQGIVQKNDSCSALCDYSYALAATLFPVRY